MISYTSFVGRLLRLNKCYPIYDDNDNIIGHTSKEDLAVVIHDNLKSEFKDFQEIECTIATGKFAGYDRLALNKNDIKKASYVGVEDDPDVYVGVIKLHKI